MPEILLYFLLFAITTGATISLVLVTIGLITMIATKVPYAPVPKKRVKQMIDLFNLTPGQKFYDLGCGDGRFVAEAAKRGADAIGFEISPWVYARAHFKTMLVPGKAKIVFKNFYTTDLSDADAIYCFLIDKVMQKVENKLIAELKPGAKVISYGFKLPNWQPEQVILSNLDKPRSSKIYIYIKK